jgi:MoaA/NifB/PqqE/SkfB family radical SAM enzyme
MCGNLGDPIIAQDCVKIFEYLRETNPAIRLSMNTNGSARSWQFWKKLAELNVSVRFGIDGLIDTHSLYRVGTDWVKILDNAKFFIKSGGEATWDMLIFKHNEFQVDICREMSEAMGFKHFQAKHTSRFKDGKFNVLDESGKTTHILYPTDISKSHTPKVMNIEPSEIQCKAQKYKQIYVSANGIVSPCCWLDFSWQLPNQDNRVEYMDAIGLFPNLHGQTLADIFSSGYFKKIEDTWAVKPLIECSKQCGKFDKLGAQFVGN